MKIQTNRCQICGREIKEGMIGPECAKKYAAGIQAAGSSAERIEVLEREDDSLINAHLRAARLAIGQGKIAFAKARFEMADRRAWLVGIALPPVPATWCEDHFSSDCADAVAI